MLQSRQDLLFFLRSITAAGCLVDSSEKVSLEFSAGLYSVQMIMTKALLLPSSILAETAAASSADALLFLCEMDLP